jgi:hypothetical protein
MTLTTRNHFDPTSRSNRFAFLSTSRGLKARAAVLTLANQRGLKASATGAIDRAATAYVG